MQVTADALAFRHLRQAQDFLVASARRLLMMRGVGGVDSRDPDQRRGQRAAEYCLGVVTEQDDLDDVGGADRAYPLPRDTRGHGEGETEIAEDQVADAGQVEI